jgi:hypothetical protein
MRDAVLAHALEPVVQFLQTLREALEIIEAVVTEDYRHEGREIEPSASLGGEQ